MSGEVLSGFRNDGVVVSHLTSVGTPKIERQSRLGPREDEPFEVIYRAHVGAVSAFFARRSTEPQTVADLTSETFARALASIHTYHGRGSIRAWLIAIARAVYAQHHATLAAQRAGTQRLGGLVVLHEDDIDDLLERIDAQQAGRELLRRAASMPELERAAIELVDLAGLPPRDAASTLGISPGAMRVRLFRARTRLRKEGRPR